MTTPPADREMPGATSLPVSVVIATLGGETLRPTLEHLNGGTVVPAEILICIPQGHSHKVKDLESGNVRVVATECRGQVPQRVEGFKAASAPLVLQMDDDMYFRRDTLELLVETIGTDRGLAVAPSFYDVKTGEYRSFLVPRDLSRRTLSEMVLYWVVNGSDGYQPGQIGSSGVNMGLPETPPDWTDLGWLSGGCVLHWRHNLVLENYYPFPGKAYAEDLFHTLALRKKNVRLARCGRAACDGDFSSSAPTRPGQFISAYVDYGARMGAFVRLAGKSVLRLRMFLVLNLVRLVARKVRRRRR